MMPSSLSHCISWALTGSLAGAGTVVLHFQNHDLDEPLSFTDYPACGYSCNRREWSKTELKGRKWGLTKARLFLGESIAQGPCPCLP